MQLAFTLFGTKEIVVYVVVILVIIGVIWFVVRGRASS